MVDTTPLNQSPQDDEPELENSTAPIAAENAPNVPAPSESPARVPVSAAPAGTARSRRGLVLAGSIVAAVIVLGGTFGGGVLVGTSVRPHHGVTDVRQGPGGADMNRGPGHRGGAGPQSGTDSKGGPGSRDSANGGSTNGGPGTGTNATPPSGTGQGKAPGSGTNGSTGSTNG